LEDGAVPKDKMLVAEEKEIGWDMPHIPQGEMMSNRPHMMMLMATR